MTDRSAIFEATARLRRQFPRSEDVLLICAEAERVVNAGRGAPKRDRAGYMREWRARKKVSA
jgi:hypothetical protein